MDVRKFAAAMVLGLCFGAIHAYGVLLVPIEHWLKISRAQASLGYSAAIVSVTAGVYLTSRLEAMLGVRKCLLACGLAATLGLLVAAASSNFLGLLAGYSAIYGFANGVAYSLSLSLAAQAMAGHEKRALGFATAAYGLGAVLFAQGFAASAPAMNMEILLSLLASLNLVACLLAVAWTRDDKGQTAQKLAREGSMISPQLALVWICYFLGAFSGLMVLAHAPSIAAWHGSSLAGVVAGLVSLGSVTGCFLGGFMAEKISGRMAIALPLFLQMIVIGSLPLGMELPAVLAALGFAGISYGVLTAAIPVEVLRLSGPGGFARDYGKMVTAWGLAGVAGPVTAGYIFDLNGGYSMSLAIAAGLSAVSFALFVGIRLEPAADRRNA